MKKLIAAALSALMLLPLAACGSGQEKPEPPGEKSYAPDAAAGYTAEMNLRKTIAVFQYGTEMPYDRYNTALPESSWHARSFAGRAPVYSYTPRYAGGPELEYYSNSGWASDESDSACNSFAVYGRESGSVTGTVQADYLMYVPPLSAAGSAFDFGGYPAEYANYLDLSDYETLNVVMSASSSDGSAVRYRLYLKNVGSDSVQIYEYSGESGVRNDIRVQLKPDLPRDRVEFLRFEHVAQDQPADVTVTYSLYFIEARAAAPAVTRDTTVAGNRVQSEYLGNVLYTKWGAYSASGFYDSSDGKWKLWYGAGLPERDSSDNVYYIETTDLDSCWSKPKRIVMDDSTGYKLVDPSGKLKRHDEQIGYGGDPGVVKVDGTYYMYFSALENGLDDGTYTHWNKIYVATSKDAKTWTVQGVPLDCATGGLLGYGGGSPSVVYYEGEFYMYYYTQAPDSRYPDEPCGLVLKKSADGVNFGRAISINPQMSTMDVKYIPSLRKWVGTYYSEANQFAPNTRGGVHVAFSEDGIEWMFDHSDNSLIAQNLDIPINHNPGLIGNELGHGYETMFLTYGANDLTLTIGGKWFSAAQYDARQLEWSRVTIR